MAGIIKQTLSPRLYWSLLQLYQGLVAGFNQNSYSQEGEDMILRRIFENRANGFYVDVGAHHPKRFSNTYFFYKKGWKGINIDCNPGSMRLFQLFRKKDINLELAISNKFEQLKYHSYIEPAINTFTPSIWDKNNNHILLKTMEIETVTLEFVLSRFLKEGTAIDFISIDVEGMDFKVLKSNNWSKFRPKIVLVEDTTNNDEYLMNSPIYQFLLEQEYVLYAKTINTLIFRERFFIP
jgi:FkbM family methyltransferase